MCLITFVTLPSAGQKTETFKKESNMKAFFSVLENTQHLLAGVYNTWRDNIQSEWYQVNVIDCTEGSNWTESYGVEEDGYLLSEAI